jgi:hypothetical protein
VIITFNKSHVYFIAYVMSRDVINYCALSLDRSLGEHPGLADCVISIRHDWTVIGGLGN